MVGLDIQFDFSTVSEILSFESDDLFEISEKFGIDPSFQWFDADLKGVDFKGRNLNGFDLSQSIFSQNSFSKCQLFFCDFSDAYINEIDLEGSFFAGTAIWPLNFAGSLSSLDDQRVLRQIKIVYDLVNCHWLDIDEDADSRYNLAVSLDNVGHKLHPGVYLFAQYVLMNPAKRNESIDEDFIRSIGVSSAIPDSVSQAMLWILQNQISAEVAYGFEQIDDSYKSIPHFFWREREHFESFEFDFRLINDDGEGFLEDISKKLNFYSSRNLPWRWALMKNNEFAFRLKSDPSLDVIQGVRSLLSSFPGEFINKTKHHFVWPYYLTSIHSRDPNLRRTMRQVSEAMFAEFLDSGNIADEAYEALERHPNFWLPSGVGLS